MTGLSGYEENFTPYRTQQPPRFDNETITISSTVSSPKSGLANPAVDFSIDDKRPVLFYVNEIHLDVLAMDIHDGESLLPISRSLGICGLFEVHEVSYLDPMQNTP